MTMPRSATRQERLHLPLNFAQIRLTLKLRLNHAMPVDQVCHRQTEDSTVEIA